MKRQHIGGDFCHHEISTSTLKSNLVEINSNRYNFIVVDVRFNVNRFINGLTLKAGNENSQYIYGEKCELNKLIGKFIY